MKNKKILPSLAELEQVKGKIKQIPNKKGEYLRRVHYGCYLLCSESGLRISEAVKFDLSAKNKKGLYRINKCKGNKTRYVYVSKEIVRELKKQNWQPNQTNRFAFYHFLRKIKRELNISKNVELSPHTFRRAFTTYHANSGMPLPLLQKLLGHSSIRTTALYWKNIYGDDDPDDILTGKKWLENREKEPSETPTENFPKQLPKIPNSDIISNKPIVSAKKPTHLDNSLLNSEKEKNLAITNHQPKSLISKISPKTSDKFLLNTSEQLSVITNKEQPINKEQILLTRIKQLEEQLAKVQTENNNLKLENKHLKSLIKKDQKTEAKILQLPPFKPNK